MRLKRRYADVAQHVLIQSIKVLALFPNGKKPGQQPFGWLLMRPESGAGQGEIGHRISFQICDETLIFHSDA